MHRPASSFKLIHCQLKKNHAIFCSNSLLYKMAIIITIPGFIKLKQHRGKNFKSKNIMEMEVTAFIP